MKLPTLDAPTKRNSKGHSEFLERRVAFWFRCVEKGYEQRMLDRERNLVERALYDRSATSPDLEENVEYAMRDMAGLRDLFARREKAKAER